MQHVHFRQKIPVGRHRGCARRGTTRRRRCTESAWRADSPWRSCKSSLTSCSRSSSRFASEYLPPSLISPNSTGCYTNDTHVCTVLSRKIGLEFVGHQSGVVHGLLLFDPVFWEFYSFLFTRVRIMALRFLMATAPLYSICDHEFLAYAYITKAALENLGSSLTYAFLRAWGIDFQLILTKLKMWPNLLILKLTNYLWKTEKFIKFIRNLQFLYNFNKRLR